MSHVSPPEHRRDHLEHKQKRRPAILRRGVLKCLAVTASIRCSIRSRYRKHRAAIRSSCTSVPSVGNDEDAPSIAPPGPRPRAEPSIRPALPKHSPLPRKNVPASLGRLELAGTKCRECASSTLRWNFGIPERCPLSGAIPDAVQITFCPPVQMEKGDSPRHFEANVLQSSNLYCSPPSSGAQGSNLFVINQSDEKQERRSGKLVSEIPERKK